MTFLTMMKLTLTYTMIGNIGEAQLEREELQHDYNSE